jgi:DNA-binding Lrp family transcriptional regulator
MDGSRAGVGDPDGGRLDERVLSALQGLAGRVAFSGLRRMLGAHPESLSRSLRRLAREGLVEKGAGGYRALGVPPRVDARTDRDLRTIARIDLPGGTAATALVGRLVGRWFGTLRWVGVLQRPEGELLAWARRAGGGLVLLGVRSGVLSVFAPTATEEEDPDESEEAAYELLFHAVEAMRPVPGAPLEPALAVLAFAVGPASRPVEN